VLQFGFADEAGPGEEAGDVGHMSDVDELEDDLLDGDERIITVSDGMSLEAKELLGVFWPTKVRERSRELRLPTNLW
jgi:hypothetical protein